MLYAWKRRQWERWEVTAECEEKLHQQHLADYQCLSRESIPSFICFSLSPEQSESHLEVTVCSLQDWGKLLWYKSGNQQHWQDRQQIASCYFEDDSKDANFPFRCRCWSLLTNHVSCCLKDVIVNLILRLNIVHFLERWSLLVSYLKHYTIKSCTDICGRLVWGGNSSRFFMLASSQFLKA